MYSVLLTLVAIARMHISLAADQLDLAIFLAQIGNWITIQHGIHAQIGTYQRHIAGKIKGRDILRRNVETFLNLSNATCQSNQKKCSNLT